MRDAGLSTEAVPAASTNDEDAIVALSRVVARATRTLGEAGHPELASRLAAEGWAAVRHMHRGSAERLTGTLHYLARLPGTDRPVPAAATPATSSFDSASREVPTMSDSSPHSPAGADAPAGADQALDVRTEAPARRHELIFSTWQALPVGEAFVLVNDHDPKPLYYQFAAEHADEFSWEYLEEGPEVWRVRVGRTA